MDLSSNVDWPLPPHLRTVPPTLPTFRRRVGMCVTSRLFASVTQRSSLWSRMHMCLPNQGVAVARSAGYQNRPP
eukprot:12889603-Prorocentrum_lima.AAC.1